MPLPPRLPGRAPASDRGKTTHVAGTSLFGAGSGSETGDSALALLVARVGLADDHDAAVPPDDPAVVADPLDARLDLHGLP